MKTTLAAFFCLILVGCGESAPLAANAPHQVLSYRDESQYPLSPSTKIFLVAGGKDNANFAEEVIRQRKIWMGAGYASNEIACYYAIPFSEGFWQDEAQYRALAPELRECYAASSKRIYRHLAFATEHSPSFLYLYATSHGSLPLSEELKKPRLDPNEHRKIEMRISLFPALDQFFLTTDVAPDDSTAGSNTRAMLAAEGVPESDLFFTPRYLKRVLATVQAATIPKYLTIQGCYSGGFVSPLADLPRISVMTASDYNRSSFGCDDGAEQTFFGSVYNEQLGVHVRDPNRMDWLSLHEAVKKGVTELEAKAKVEEFSYPQFESTL